MRLQRAHWLASQCRYAGERHAAQIPGYALAKRKNPSISFGTLCHGIGMSALERLGGRVTAANIAFDDHPPAKRYSGQIETITADSVFRWLERNGLGSAVVTVGLR